MNDGKSFAPKPARAASVWFVLIAVFIDMVGIGIAIPVLPILIGAYTASREMQAWWNMGLSVAFGLMQFLCAPMLGAISDSIGRRFELIEAIIGLGFIFFMFAIEPTLQVLLF